MRRTHAVTLSGLLLVAGGAGAGTANAHQPDHRDGPPGVEQLEPSPDRRPDFPGPDPRVVEPDVRRPGAMPHVVPREPGPVPIPHLRPSGPRAVPMPELGQGGDLLVPLPELMRRRQRTSGPQ